MIKLNKRGQGLKYDVLIALLIGLIIVAIVLWFLFHEYFTSEDISWETCRQSIILRANTPEKDLVITTVGVKGIFPLKCKTEVVNINYKDVKKVQTEFGNSLLSAWYLVGNGMYKIFPSSTWDFKSHCIIVKRIHLDSKVRDYYNITSENKISLRDALNSNYKNGINFYSYIKSVNKEANPFLFIKRASDDDNFRVLTSGYSLDVTLFLKVLAPTLAFTGIYDNNHNIQIGKDPEGPGVIVPGVFDPAKGDLFIVVASPARSEKEITPYIVWLQANSLNELQSSLGGFLWLDASVCDYIETVPA